MASSPAHARSSARSRSSSLATRMTYLSGAESSEAGTSKGSAVTRPISVPRSVVQIA